MFAFLCVLGLTLASNSGLLQPVNIAVIAKTDGADYSDTDDGATLKLLINGVWRQSHFPDLAGDDMMKHKSDWFEWSASSFYGWNRLNQLQAIKIRARGNDGWKFEDISVFVEDSNENWHTVAMHHNIDQWIDGDSNVPQEVYINMNVNNWMDCISHGHVMEVQLFAETEGSSNAGSDDQARLHIHTSTGATEVKTLADLEGNDYLENKSDWWQWSLNRAYKAYEIDSVILQSGGSDGWNPRKAMVVVKTSTYEYQVVAFDRDIQWLDDWASTSLRLRHCPFEYSETIAYWNSYGSGNGGPGTSHGIGFSFSETDTTHTTTSNSKALFQSTTDTSTTSFETGAQFKVLSASSKYERSVSNTNSQEVTSSVSSGISSSIGFSTTYEHQATAPGNMPAGSLYVLYTKDIYRKHNYGDGTTLVTFDYIFKWGACRDVHPNCVSSAYCLDEQCMTCTVPEAMISTTFEGVRSECIPDGHEPLRCDPNNLDWSCCTPSNPCGEGEGDCDRDSDCQGSMVCLHDTHHFYFDTCGYQ